ncbi:hypothetical protein GXW74_01080 [Roseomonas eburnea]|uniref:Uncharacterized protein n=1 Tax=Neoroseomonas eburnea TaxID=1346889 RepID=A0A9X9X5T0_9PROT|nr:hypothetical protein [Neoroseomonas eburnea]MBR0679066.1 hypothetical protein [Neoroseomonas eburnea]
MVPEQVVAGMAAGRGARDVTSCCRAWVVGALQPSARLRPEGGKVFGCRAGIGRASSL